MEVGGRRCRVFCAGLRLSVSGNVGDGDGCPLLVQLVSERQEEDLEREAEMIAAAGMPFTLVAVPVRDWELELMPWAEPAVSKRPEVGTGAGETLRYLMEALLPAVLPPPPAGTPPCEGGEPCRRPSTFLCEGEASCGFPNSSPCEGEASCGSPSSSPCEREASCGFSSSSPCQGEVPEGRRGIAERCADVYRRVFDELNTDGTVRLFPHVLETIKALHDRGLQLAICSSRGRPTLEGFVKTFHLEHYVSMVVSANDVERHKPHPEPVQKILAALGVAPGEAVVVGDASYDILMGRAAGCRTVGVTYGNQSAADLRAAGADVLIDDFAQLLD